MAGSNYWRLMAIIFMGVAGVGEEGRRRWRKGSEGIQREHRTPHVDDKRKQGVLMTLTICALPIPPRCLQLVPIPNRSEPYV
jgi:hypothetical protein